MRRVGVNQTTSQHFINVMCLGQNDVKKTLKVQEVPRATIKELIAKNFSSRTKALVSNTAFEQEGREIISCKFKLSKDGILLVKSSEQKCQYVINITTGTVDYFPY